MPELSPRIALYGSYAGSLLLARGRPLPRRAVEVREGAVKLRDGWREIGDLGEGEDAIANRAHAEEARRGEPPSSYFTLPGHYARGVTTLAATAGAATGALTGAVIAFLTALARTSISWMTRLTMATLPALLT